MDLHDFLAYICTRPTALLDSLPSFSLRLALQSQSTWTALPQLLIFFDPITVYRLTSFSAFIASFRLTNMKMLLVPTNSLISVKLVINLYCTALAKNFLYLSPHQHTIAWPLFSCNARIIFLRPLSINLFASSTYPGRWKLKMKHFRRLTAIHPLKSSHFRDLAAERSLCTPTARTVMHLLLNTPAEFHWKAATGQFLQPILAFPQQQILVDFSKKSCPGFTETLSQASFVRRSWNSPEWVL